MTSANGLSGDDVLGCGLSLIVGATAEERAKRLAATLAPLDNAPVRLVRVANPLQSKLSLKRILIQVGHAEDTGTTDAGQIMQALIQALSSRHDSEEHVLLVVEGAETLEPEAALSLQTLAATLKDGLPALHVLLVGSPAVSELGMVGAAPVPTAGPLAPQAAKPDVSPIDAEPVSKPLTWRRTLTRAALAAAPLGFMLAWAYPRLPQHHSAAVVTAIPAEPPSRPAPPSVPPTQAEQATATPEQATAAPVPAPQAVESREARKTRLRADFDQFLASSGKATARLTRSKRDALFQEYLTWHAHQPPSGRSY